MEKDMAGWPSSLFQAQTSHFAGKIWIKIFFWLSLWAITWWTAIFAPIPGPLRICVAFLHVLTHPFIALNIGHDANHNAITSHPLLQALLKRSFDLIGISSWCWRLNHNRIHHPYTSVPGIDTTADGKKLLRLNPTEKRYFFHGLQHFYAPFAYGLVTLNYVFLRDFRDFYRLLNRPDGKKYIPTLAECLTYKALYIFIMLIIPIMVLPYPPLTIIGTFFAAHFFLGQIIILIQVPHFNLKTMPVSEKDVPENRTNELAFVLKHTTDMAPTSRFWNWLLGGTNTHAIHHLFPGVCHTQYCQMTEALIKFCDENDLSYNCYTSVAESYMSHYRYLKQMGRG